MSAEYKGVNYSDGLFRAAVREMAHQKCAACGRRTVPGEVHHLFSRRHDIIRWDPRNGILICGDCHRQAHDRGWVEAYRKASPHYSRLEKLKNMNFKDFLAQRGLTKREFQQKMNKANGALIRNGAR